MPDQPPEQVRLAIVQLRRVLETLDAANEHVAAALVADALIRLGADPDPFAAEDDARD